MLSTASPEEFCVKTLIRTMSVKVLTTDAVILQKLSKEIDSYKECKGFDNRCCHFTEVVKRD